MMWSNASTLSRFGLRKTGLAMALALAFGSAALADAWTTYVNPRFGTRADVPAEGFVADPPPQNGGGQSWSSTDGRGRISVYGTFTVVADSFKGYRAFTLDAARDDGVAITYSAAKGDWFAYSGTVGSEIVYEKAVLSRACDPVVANHIYLRYPADQRARYNAIVKRMATSLRGGPGADCG